MPRKPKADATLSTFAAQTLERGLDVLAAIVASPIGLTPGEVAKALHLSRPAAYRAIAGLVSRGFVCDVSTGDAPGRYVLARAALAQLTARIMDDARAAALNRIMLGLCAQVKWPVSVAGPMGLRMLVWATTDSATSLTLERFAAGFHVPMLESASGLCYLAHVAEPEQAALLARLAASKEPFADLARDKPRVTALLKDARKRGYAMTTHEPVAQRIRRRARTADSQTMGRTTSFSVPVMLNGAPLACLALRFFESAMSRPKAAQRYLRALHEAAADIAAVWGSEISNS